MAEKQNVVVHLQIGSKKSQIVTHVMEEATDFSSEMNNMRWMVLFKQEFCRSIVAKR